MDPRYFGTVNRGRQIPPMLANRSKLRHLSATRAWCGNEHFVDTDRRFGLYSRPLVMGPFGANDAGQRVDTRCGKGDR